MNSPRISVIIPVYKVEQYIGACLESVVTQTMTDIEIIVVNDGTPDRSAEIAREYAARDPRMRVIDQSNQGAAGARNTGLKAATSPLVMFVDSDDVVTPDYCEKLYNALADDVDVVICEVELSCGEGVKHSPALEKWFELPASTDSKWVNTVPVNKIFRLDIIREHGIEFPVGLRTEDEFFWHSYQPWCRGKAFVREKLYIYQQRADSVMGVLWVDRGSLQADILHIAAHLGDYYDRHGLMADPNWAEHYWRVFDHLVRTSQMHRPERFQFHILKRKRRSLGATIRRGIEKLKNRMSK